MELARSLGLQRVADDAERLAGVLPQAAWRLDPGTPAGPDEVRIRADRLNLDAASYRQLHDANGGEGAKIRSAVCEIVASRGKMHNPVTGSGGMLTGVVTEAGPQSPLGLKPGDRVATLVSLTLTPLEIHDGLASWDGLSEQVPCDATATLFARSIAAVLPEDLPVPLALSVMDVCGAAALTRRVVSARLGTAAEAKTGPVVAVLGAAGKSGSLSAAAAREAGASWIIAVVPTEAEAALLLSPGGVLRAPPRSIIRTPRGMPDGSDPRGTPPDPRARISGMQAPAWALRRTEAPSCLAERGGPSTWSRRPLS